MALNYASIHNKLKLKMGTGSTLILYRKQKLKLPRLKLQASHPVWYAKNMRLPDPIALFIHNLCTWLKIGIRGKVYGVICFVHAHH
jgi:hypothetical protein